MNTNIQVETQAEIKQQCEPMECYIPEENPTTNPINETHMIIQETPPKKKTDLTMIAVNGKELRFTNSDFPFEECRSSM